MLFLDSKTLNHAVDADARTRLLKELQALDIVPLLRSHLGTRTRNLFL